MTTIDTSVARRGAALVAAIAALAIATPPAGASLTPLAPKPASRQMHWYHWHQQGQMPKFGSTAVLGLESMRDLTSLRAAYGFERVRPIPALHAAAVSVDQTRLHALLADARTDRRIRYVSPLVSKRRAMSMPNDPLLHTVDTLTNLPYEWSFGSTHVGRALDFSKGDPGIAVGVIDTGVADVPDLAGKIDSVWTVSGTEISQSPPEGNDEVGHGTAVASLIAANVDDGFGMAGFGGATHVIGVHASTDIFFFDASVAIALTKLVSLGVRIVNMSLGGTMPSDPILVDAIHQAAAKGVLLVAAAGNNHGAVTWPAAELQPSGGGRSYGLAVGASNVDGRLASFSNWGKHLSVVAPGNYDGQCSGVLVALPPESMFDDSCFLTWPGDGHARYGAVAGTSFSAPEVTGVAALIWAARPELKNYQVADIIKQSAHRDATDWTPTMGCGVLDAGAALELATSRRAAVWPEPPDGDGAVCSVAGDQPPRWPGEVDQTIIFAPLPNRTFGDPDIALKAKTTSGLFISYTASGACTVNAAAVHLTGPGSCTITAAHLGNQDNPATSVSQTFLIADAPAPSVLAQATSGRWGTKVRLPFRASIHQRLVTASIVVERNGATIARLSRKVFKSESGRLYNVGWRAPKVKTKGAYRLCVTLLDGAGRKSKPSCASIRLR